MMNRLESFAFNFILCRYTKESKVGSTGILVSSSNPETVVKTVGPDKYCSPRHLIPFTSRNEGLLCGG
jgi:hypothetical protein